MGIELSNLPFDDDDDGSVLRRYTVPRPIVAIVIDCGIAHTRMMLTAENQSVVSK